MRPVVSIPAPQPHPAGRALTKPPRPISPSAVARPAAPPPVPASKGRPPSGRKSGKQPGSKGICRSEPLTAERSQSHRPTVCAHCGTPFEIWDAVVCTAEAFPVLELARTPGGIRIAGVEHRYEVLRCACGQTTAAAPGMGVLSFQEERKRDLLVTKSNGVQGIIPWRGSKGQRPLVREAPSSQRRPNNPRAITCA